MEVDTYEKMIEGKPCNDQQEERTMKRECRSSMQLTYKIREEGAMQ